MRGMNWPFCLYSIAGVVKVRELVYAEPVAQTTGTQIIVRIARYIV